MGHVCPTAILVHTIKVDSFSEISVSVLNFLLISRCFDLENLIRTLTCSKNLFWKVCWGFEVFLSLHICC